MFDPWPALILGVDPGKNSGWATFWNGEYLDSGECKSTDEAAILQVTSTVAMLGTTYGTKPVLVIEQHPWAGSLTAKSSLEASRAIWKMKWGTAGEAARRTVDVNVATWRSRLGIPTRGDKKLRARIELNTARSIAARDLGPDEAAAVLIGKWGTFAPELAYVLPKAVTRQA